MPYSKVFREILKNTKKTYLGKEVPLEYQKDYGKIYNKKDVLSTAFRIAKSRGIPIE